MTKPTQKRICINFFFATANHSWAKMVKTPFLTRHSRTEGDFIELAGAFFGNTQFSIDMHYRRLSQ